MQIHIPSLGVLAIAAGLAACMDPDEPGRLVPRTVDEDPTLPRIEIADTSLHAEAFGDPTRPMIVVLHGGPGLDYRYMLPMKALVDDGYYLVFWDQRGTGLSRRHDRDSYTLDGYLEDLRLVIEHYSNSPTQPIVLLGQSWGAMYATWFINTYGDYGGRVVGAVLSEPGALTRKGLEDYQAQQFPPWSFTSEELNDYVWSEQVMSPGDHARADYLWALGALDDAPREHNDPSKPELRWRMGAVALSSLTTLALDNGFDWTTHLGAYPHRVLFARGELNENLPLAHQQELASHFASADLVTVPGVGHEGMWEKPDEFLAHIRNYLAEVMP